VTSSCFKTALSIILMHMRGLIAVSSWQRSGIALMASSVILWHSSRLIRENLWKWVTRAWNHLVKSQNEIYKDEYLNIFERNKITSVELMMKPTE